MYAAVGRPSPPPVVAPVAPSPLGPAGFAQLFVSAFLPAGEGDTSGLTPFLANPPDLNQVTAGTMAATSTTVVDAHQIGPRYWAVTVAAQVEEMAKGVWAPLGVRYYDVGVVASAGRFVATGLPEEVAGPAPATAPAPVGGAMSPPTSGNPETDTVSHFLGALLAGQGELSRYTPVSSPLRPVSPAPFTSVTVTGISTVPARRGPSPSLSTQGAAGSVWVEAQIAATDTAGQTQQLSYNLALDRQAGQWEVTNLIPAVPLVSNP
jgi:hypothetical protein